MATETLPQSRSLVNSETNGGQRDFGAVALQVLRPLASLKLTVVLFALAIFIVLAGTLAQVEMDIWQVIDQYFRTMFAYVEFQIFFPPAFFPSQPQVPGGFWFPGGWLIGTLMTVNLIAAHAVRFTVQANGTRLGVGTAVLAIGGVLTWLVVAGASNEGGLQAAAWMGYGTLWKLCLAGLGALVAGMGYGLFRLPTERTLEKWSLATGITLLGGLLIWLLAGGESLQPSDSAMRILWQLTQGSLAGIVLLVGCVMVFRKRAGIVLLHFGVGLMMLSELLVGLTAVEAQLRLDEGAAKNYVEDIREFELAFVDTSDPENEVVTVVPAAMLMTEGAKVQHEDLPVDIEVVKYHQNSSLARPEELEGKNIENPATAGIGEKWVAVPTRPGAGTDTDGAVDMSAAYLRLTGKDGTDLGTRLLALIIGAQEIPERITVGDKTYDAYLRFHRIYKPYTVKLEDVRKDDYLGTNTPRNYSSDVRLVDASRNIDRDVHIWMNNPLRFAGETFYQSGFFRDPATGIESTTLSVVSNESWMLPYVSCMIVAIGLLSHFSIALMRFLTRRATGRAATINPMDADESNASRDGMDTAPTLGPKAWMAYGVPALLVVVWGGWALSKAAPPRTPSGKMDLYAFGQLPVVYDGRAKPLDTFARNSLLLLSDRQEFKDENDNKQPAIRWLLDVIADPEVAIEHKVFRITNLDLLDQLGLERRKGFRYSLAEFRDKLPELSKQTEEARKLDTEDLSLYQRKMLELEGKIGRWDLIAQAFSPPRIRVEPEHIRQDLMEAIRRQQQLDRRHPPLAIPVVDADEGKEWETFSSAWMKDVVLGAFEDKEAGPATAAMSKVIIAYGDRDAEDFNQAVADYHAYLNETIPAGVTPKKVSFEAFINNFQPFYYSAVLYVVAFVLAVLAWLGWFQVLNRSAFWLIVFTLAIHTFALSARIYISGRPPVTNLYSSAVFIGWGAVILGIVLELVYRIGIGNVIASVAGFATLLIAQFLAAEGDTLAVLQAVLDTNFWLATHVTCITLGYATTYVAGLLGIIYVVLGVLTPVFNEKLGRELARMIYGVVCFSIFFSFVGTVLGGLWADDSWGRFWGWDPKENGALIIVLWNALVLHARWGKMVKDRGLALLAIAGNIAVSWSWFGVNELGVGLHSYGFTEGVLMALGVFCVTQLGLIGMGLLPRDVWLSSRLKDSAAA